MLAFISDVTIYKTMQNHICVKSGDIILPCRIHASLASAIVFASYISFSCSTVKNSCVCVCLCVCVCVCVCVCEKGGGGEQNMILLRVCVCVGVLGKEVMGHVRVLLRARLFLEIL